MEFLLFFGIIVGGFAIFNGVYQASKDKEYFQFQAKRDKELKNKLAQEELTLKQKNKNDLILKEKSKIESELAFKKSLIDKADQELKKTANLKGNKKVRTWYGTLYAEVESLLDNYRAKYLKYKKHPSKKGSEVVKEVKKEKRELNKQLKVLEYEIKTYEQYFPIIEDFKDYILEDDSFLITETGDIAQDRDYDPVQKFLKPEEYKKLSTEKKNQLALDRYLEKKHTKLEIGRFYERYIGYLYEKDGWTVKWFGIIEGFDDLGRDLICTKGKEIHIVQTKNWSRFKIIREKYLYQHFATTIHYELQNKINTKKFKVIPVFYSTIDYSPMAKQVSKALKIDIQTEKMSKNYPMIKCNVNPRTKEKIYHLPFDQQYDKIIIGNNPGELYVKTVKEAEKKGFRRAFRYMGPA